MNRIQAGSLVPIRIQVYNNTVDPPVLFAPSSGVTVTVTDSAAVVVVNNQAMSTSVTGVYTYNWQSLTTSTLGDYLVKFKVVDTSGTSYEPNTVGFTLVNETGIASSPPDLTGLNANYLLGNTWASPGEIGSLTPNFGTFTNLTVTGTITGTVSNTNQLENKTWEVPGTIGSTTPNTGAFTTLTAGTSIQTPVTLLGTAGSSSGLIIKDQTGASSLGIIRNDGLIVWGATSPSSDDGINATRLNVLQTGVTAANHAVVIRRAEALNMIDTQGGQNAALYVSSIGNNISGGGIKAQPVAIRADAAQQGSGDVAGFFAIVTEDTTSTGTGGAFGLYATVQAKSATTSAVGTSISVDNLTGTDDTYVLGTTMPRFVGHDISYGSSKRGGFGAMVRTTGTEKWEAAYAVWPGSCQSYYFLTDKFTVSAAGLVAIPNASNDATTGLAVATNKLQLFQDGTNGVVGSATGVTFSTGTGLAIGAGAVIPGAAGVINLLTGLRIGNAATSGHVLRGNGTNYVDAALAAADLSNGVTGSGGVVLAAGPTVAGALTVTSTGITNGNAVILKAGGNTGSDGATLQWISNAGTSDMTMFHDAAGGTGRLKALGNLVLHAGDAAVSATNAFLTVFTTGGINVGAPTGGDKGNGTINIAGLIYANGTAGVASFGPAAVASITVKNGIITAIS